MEYTEYIYEAFSFERPIQLYVRLILVLMTLLINTVVIIVLSHRKLRSLTNVILVAIAISDTLTGLVTLPTYLMVYTRSDSDQEPFGLIENGTNEELMDHYSGDYEGYHYMYYPEELYVNWTDIEDTVHTYDAFFVLSKPLCEAFMIAEFYFSRVFHTISIWLTVYLAVQRYICLKLPFRSDDIFTTRNTIIAMVIIIIAAPVLHVFHLVDDKATPDGFCAWRIETDCTGSCAHLWATLIFRHMIPCLILTGTTVAFVYLLLSSRFNVGNNARMRENRRISVIVIVVVVTFLIPEFPYGLFMLYSSIKGHLKIHGQNDLRTNRAIHITYEMVLLLSFNVNFYVFVFMNRRFRLKLKELLSCEYRGKETTASTRSRAGTATRNGIEMKHLNNGTHTAKS